MAASDVCDAVQLNRYLHRVLAPMVEPIAEQERAWPYAIEEIRGRQIKHASTGERPDSCKADVPLAADDCHWLPQVSLTYLSLTLWAWSRTYLTSEPEPERQSA